MKANRLNEKGQEVNLSPSMTVPGMAYTIPELIKRLSQGIPVKRTSMEYGEDEDTIFVPKDLTDIDVMTNEVIRSKKAVANAVKQRSAKQEEVERLKAIENEVQSRLKEISEKSQQG